jgi:LacI family transcriptional regulator, galactose operon repressor
VTIKDIARLAGVSHSTVSRALNNSPHISKETCSKIRSIAERVQFEFNAGARSLSSKRTGIIGVIYHSVLDVFGSSLYTNQLFLDLRHNLERYHLDSILLQPYNPVTGNSNITRLIRQKKVDGFLIVDAGISGEEYELIGRNGLPVVQLHLAPAYFPEESLDIYLTDNVAGGDLACQHLIEAGCKRVLTITSDCERKTNREFKQRVMGYRQALQRNGMPCEEDLVVDVGECSFEAGRSFVRSHEALLRGVNGIFAQADIIALGCIVALKDLGLSVPGDVKVIGYDDCSVCTMSQPAVSSIHQPREELARRACERLNDLLEGAGGPAVQAMFPPTLVVRESSIVVG